MTEQELVYSIIETLNAYQYNNDNPINERVVRNLIYSYRGEVIRKFYSDGEDVTDECFQTVNIILDKRSKNYFQGNIPAMIRLKDRNGFFVKKFGVTIPIVNNTSFYVAEDRDLPLGNATGSKLQIRIKTRLDNCVNVDSEKSVVHYQLLKESKNDYIEVDLNAILVNPEDAEDYDWLNSVFPFPAEKIDELKTTILRKEFGITSQVKPDEVQNNRVDNVRYHENTNLEQ